MMQCPCPRAKDSPLQEAEQTLMDEGERAQALLASNITSCLYNSIITLIKTEIFDSS